MKIIIRCNSNFLQPFMSTLKIKSETQNISTKKKKTDKEKSSLLLFNAGSSAGGKLPIMTK